MSPSLLRSPRLRPLLSHARRDSWNSFSDSSSYEPASTIHEPRISISSTIYPSTSSHSSPTTMNANFPVIDPPDRASSLRPALSIYSTNSDRSSFIEFMSPPPEATSFNLENSLRPSPRINIDARPYMSYNPSPDSSSRARSRSPKPPLPTTPKPSFGRPTSSALCLSHRSSPRSSPNSPAPSEHSNDNDDHLDHRGVPSLPPTTNLLNANERADLIRKSRKLAQVFGQTPGPDAYPAVQEPGRGMHLKVPSPVSGGRHSHQRGTASMSSDLPSSLIRHKAVPDWPSDGTQYVSGSSRRYSTPVSPDTFSFMSEEGTASSPTNDTHIEIGSLQGAPLSESVHHSPPRNRRNSHTSFIDLSEEEVADDGISAIIALDTTPKKIGRSRAPSSIFEAMSPEEQAEEERRRKREKLTKLHRFLGSRVPTNLVLGLGDPTDSLPPPLDNSMSSLRAEEPSRTAWLRRRRSNSTTGIPYSWSDDVDRLKEELDEKEKALNVRREQKMKKVRSCSTSPPLCIDFALCRSLVLHLPKTCIVLVIRLLPPPLCFPPPQYIRLHEALLLTPKSAFVHHTRAKARRRRTTVLVRQNLANICYPIRVMFRLRAL